MPVNLAELHRRTRRAVAGETGEAQTAAIAAHGLADMVGWAPGVIDADGRIVGAFESLRVLAMSRHAATRDDRFAVLHDALAELVTAIVRHDLDLDPDG